MTPRKETQFGNFIRERRAVLCMSLQDVGEIAGITKAHVWEIERGKSRNPTIKTILGLAEALQANPVQLAALSMAGLPGVVTELTHLPAPPAERRTA